MGEIIRDWLRTRLGVIIDLSPEIFGHYAKDGTLLAKVLHSYDVINDSQLSTLLETQDPALARVNLKHLRVWLKFVGVDCEADWIDDISNGKGTMALRLFYKVYLCLENKDRLHFITLQKEREKYIPSSSKFDVTTVSEEQLIEQSREALLADSLKKSMSLMNWERKRYEDLVGSSSRHFDKFRSSQKVNEILSSLPIGPEKISTSRKSLSRLESSRELDSFAKKHRVKKVQVSSDPCENIVETGSRRPSKAVKIDEDAAKAYTKALRSKHRQEALARSFRTRMQMNLVAELWKKVLDDQELEFDEIIAKKVLHQSQYEKQLVRKLCDVRSEKSRMAANRTIVEKLLEDTREKELRLEQERAREIMVRENEEVEAEGRRIQELERIIEEQKRVKRDSRIRKFAERIVLDLVDIAIKSGEYRRESNQSQVPDLLSNQWKALFLKSQPIIEADHVFPGKYELEDNEQQPETLPENQARIRVLNDDDFHNYHNLKSPWTQFIPKVDQEVADYLDRGLIVLGYIVHKTLDSLHPEYAPESVDWYFPAMRTRAIVLGVPDSLLYEPIQQLLKKSKIHLVRLEEAINYCLGEYKAEMRDFEFIDLEVMGASREIGSGAPAASEGEGSVKKSRKGEKNGSKKSRVFLGIEKLEISKNAADKVTQTPRQIPHEDDDPVLGNSAYIGKWIHEFLSLGEPLSDALIARAIVEYLKGLDGVEGFVIVNYPNTYRQMSSLEFALSGKRLPENKDDSSGKRESAKFDEIDSIISRIYFDEPENDPEILSSGSRLVPNPTRPKLSSGPSSFTGFVRIKPKEWSKDEDEIWEVLPETASSVDEFYVDQEIASILYYTIFDLPTLKKLVRLLVAGKTELIARAESRELFGDYLDHFELRSDDYSASKAPIVKKLLRSRASEYSMCESRSSDSYESKEMETFVRGSKTRSSPLPGEVSWPWASFPQPQHFTQSLASLWQNLELCYIENLKEIFHLKRINFGAIDPYKNFVARHMAEFIERPDKKQDSLHEFHRAFNELDQQIRDSVDVKKELHCRIDHFQTNLWEVCDLRRREAQAEKDRLILEHWFTFQLIALANIYIDIFQAEMDRCNDTLQFINDYYTSMLQHPLQDVRSLVKLQRILAEVSTSGSRPEVPSSGLGSWRNLQEKESSRDTKHRASLSKIFQAPNPPEENLFKEETPKLLLDADEEPVRSAEQTLAHKTIEANVQLIEKILESLASRVLDNLKKHSSDELRSSSRKASSFRRSEDPSGQENIQHLLAEWRYASMFEINRTRVRIKILHASAKHDIYFFLHSIRRLFSDIQINIIERYDREIRAVDQMAKVFRFATEQATPIQQEMLLDADRFIVRSNVLMFPDEPQASRRSFLHEDGLSSRFTIPMLSRLLEIFGNAAPSGIMLERSFVYILQDLLVCGDVASGNRAFPLSWSKLRGCEVPRLVSELFGDDEFIDWREFIIYGSGIEMPRVDEIVRDFRSLRRMDEKSREFVSRQDFMSTDFWFARAISRENSSDFHSEENLDSRDEENFEKLRENCEKNESLERSRSALLKNLLCQMFSYDDDRVNYVAFLMAFCKDDKPEIGLGKALSLAIGNEICIDWEEGEKYVREFLDDKRDSVSSRSSVTDHEESAKVSAAIFDALLDRVFRLAAPDLQDIPEKAENLPPRIGGTPGNSETSGNSTSLESAWASEDNVTTSVHSEEPEKKNRSVTINVPEKSRSANLSQNPESPDSLAVHWLSIQVAQTVLAACLPSHAARENLLETGKSLRENLEVVYEELRGEETSDDFEAMILAHRFIHHDFIEKLLADTTRFTSKRLGNVINDIVMKK